MNRVEPAAGAALAHIAALETTPLASRIVDQSAYGLIERAARTWPSSPAYTFLPNGSADDVAIEVTYAELRARVARTANFLLQAGAKRGECIAIILPNGIEGQVAFLAAETIGIAFPINPFLTPQGIAVLMEKARARFLVAAGPRLDPEIWTKVEALRNLQTITAVIAAGVENDHSVMNFDAAEMQSDVIDPCLEGDRRTEIAAYFCTGGTTGSPKIVRQTHWNQLTNCWTLQQAYLYGPGETSFCGMPLFHVPGAFLGGLAVFGAGGHVVRLSHRGFRDPAVLQGFWRLIERFRPSVFPAVPTIIASLMDVPLNGADISSVKFAIVSAAPTPLGMMRAFETKTGVPIAEGYGQTECTVSIAFTPWGCLRKAGSVGVRKPYMSVRAARVGNGGAVEHFCAPDEVGTILCKGPNVTPGYLDSHQNAALWAGDGWLNTGDRGRIDADGYIWLTGRDKDLIKRGGHGIDPRIIEEALASHPSVALAAAVGEIDSRLGEVPVAFVTLKPGASATPDELTRLLEKTIPERAAIPRSIYVVSALPLTSVGKVLKARLRKEAACRTFTRLIESVLGAARRITVEAPEREGEGEPFTVELNGSKAEREMLERAIEVALRDVPCQWNLVVRKEKGTEFSECDTSKLVARC